MVRHGFLSQESKGELLTIFAFETFVKVACVEVFILEFPCVRNLPSFSSHSTIAPNQPRSKLESWSEIKFFVSFVSIMSTRKPDWLYHDTSQEGVFRLVPGWSFLKERKVFHICNQINWIICISKVNLFRWSTCTATWSTWSATTTRCSRTSTSSPSTSATTESHSLSPRSLWWVEKWPEELRRYAPTKVWHLDQWTNALQCIAMEQWTNWMIDQWTNGPMVPWTNSPMVLRDQWTNGPMDQWSQGPMD